MTRQDFLKLAAASALTGAAGAQQKNPDPDLGFTDTPMLPNLPWHVHDPARPYPPVVTPAAAPGGAPSDATVLFDGKDLSKWMQRDHSGKMIEPTWVVENGYFHVDPRKGDLLTREKFGDCQLHVEWSEPPDIKGTSQGRGNSGVLFMARYEIQVLDVYRNPTYADGHAGAIYGQWPPLANPVRPPGEWNVYDIVFEAPRMDGEKLISPAYFTVFFNGVCVHNRKASMGPMVYRQVAHYIAQPAEDSLMLQDHNNPVRYRNIWIRRLGNYDTPVKK